MALDYLNDFCSPESLFWKSESGLTVGSDNSSFQSHDSVDLTLCFQDTAILYGICFTFSLLAVLCFLFGSISKRPSIPHGWLHITKIVTCILMLIPPLCDVIYSVFQSLKFNKDVAIYHYVSPVVLLLTIIITVLFIEFERRRGMRSPGPLILFWLSLTLYCGIKTRTLSLIAEDNWGIPDKFRFFTFVAEFILLILQLVLSFIQEPRSSYQHLTEEARVLCPEEAAPFFSRITWWWMNSFIRKGYRRGLTYDGLYDLNNDDKSRTVSPKFEKEWNNQLNKIKGCSSSREPSLLYALTKSYGAVLFIAGFFKLGQDILAFVSPLLLKALINYVKNEDEPAWRGYLYAGVMFTAAVLQSFLLQQYYYRCYVCGMRVRTGVIAAVYRKALKLSSKSRMNRTVGEIVNLMSVDAQRFMDVTTYIHFTWSAPFQIITALTLLYLSMGLPVFAGFGVTLSLIPLNMLTGSLIRRIQTSLMIKKDSRIKIVNEVLNGIKLIKLYAWDIPFKQYIMNIRQKEVNVLRKSAYINASVSFTWACAPYMVALATFATYSIVHRNSTDPNDRLTADKAFVALSLFNLLRFPLSMAPMLISSLVEASVSLRRLSSFLKSDELDPDSVNRGNTPTSDDEDAVSVRGGTFAWDRPERPSLRNINLSVKPGELVAVVGPVGAGKSSLISAMLGEMEKINGTVTINGSVAYVPQQAWIQNATVKDNILFGKQFNYLLYRGTLGACALETDLEILPGGDMTEIGEKGINLSGGQKQRVSLARAVYQESDVYLLDDPLSAVDSHVGKHIFDKVIGPEGVLKDKVCILVTHCIGFLEECDKIIVMNDGCISEFGTYHELLDQDGAFADLLHNFGTNKKEEPKSVPTPPPPHPPGSYPPHGSYLSHLSSTSASCLSHTPPASSYTPAHTSYLSHTPRTGSAHRSEPVPVGSINNSEMPTELMSPVVTLYDISHPPLFDTRRSHSGSLKSSDEDEERSFIPSKRGISRQSSFRSSRSPSMSKGEPNERSKLIGEEKVETGNVKFSVFFDYAKACSLWISFITLFFNMLTDGAAVGQNLWLAHWSNGEEHTNKSNLALNLGVYSALGALQGIMVLFGAFSLYFGALNASMRLHNGMLSNILRSPMSFFDTTPLGRILNRFSKDIYMIDEEIPRSLRSFLITLFTVLSTIVVVSIASPWFMLAVIPLLVVYIVIQRYYVATSRQLRRLESSSRSPIYSHFQETINGSSSIRAYLKVDEFLAQSEAKVDYNQIAYYPSVCADRWLAIRVEFLGNFIILAASLFAVLQRNYDQVFGYISPGIAGLSISYALQVTQELNWMVRMTSELETNIVAVERTKEYSETPTEAASVIPGRRVPPGWPTEGRVQFDHYSTRYRPGLDLVLKNISFDIPGGQKVGIVGRTGAGKSSLTSALFRIIESAQGRILIDGVDIGTYGLYDLRSNLTIIPQDPVLFSGTLRMNLDPFDIHTDDELWRALKTAHLSGFFESLTGGESTITEGGENLSVGQRQLVCLARALLRKTKILVLDEATAAVDVETDELIQKTIRKEFSDCTVLTIAHRLNTIMDYDKIMVLDSGRIREFDTPGNLIEQRGIFYGMVKDAGLVDD